MSVFKKIPFQLKTALPEAGIEGPNDFQDYVFPKIKGGSDLMILGEEGIGKSTTLVLSVLNKLKCEAKDKAPRALIYVKDKEAALKLESNFKRFTKEMNIRILCIYDEHKIQFQKDDLFFGTDIVIAAPARLSKIYFESGIILSELQMMIVEDAEFLGGNNLHTDIDRISESLQKCQQIVFAKSMTKKLDEILDLWMEKAQIIDCND